MPRGIFSTNVAVTQGREIRMPLGDKVMMLEPNEQPLITLMSQIRSKTPVNVTKPERFEDNWIPQSGTFTANAANNATTLTVGVTAAATLVRGMILTIPNAANSATKPENLRITAVNAGAGTFDCVRGVAGTTAGAITAGTSTFVLAGTSYAENDGLPDSVFTTPVPINTYTQIFRATYGLSKSAAAKNYYGTNSPERKREHNKLISQVKIQMNKAAIHGKAGTAVDDISGEEIRYTMGLDSIIATNRVNAGGALTEAVFDSFARSVFRYGNSQEKWLLASPLVISAVNSWSRSKLNTTVGQSMYGVRITSIETGHGIFRMFRDFSLTDHVAGQAGFGGWAFAIDPAQAEMFYLKGNGINRDLALTMNLQTPGKDGFVDEVLTEVGFMFRFEQMHGKLYNVTGY